MSAHQRQPRHTPQDDDDDEEHTLLPARDGDTDDDIDDLMKQLPDDTIRGALVDAGAQGGNVGKGTCGNEGGFGASEGSAEEFAGGLVTCAVAWRGQDLVSGCGIGFVRWWLWL